MNNNFFYIDSFETNVTFPEHYVCDFIIIIIMDILSKFIFTIVYVIFIEKKVK